MANCDLKFKLFPLIVFVFFEYTMRAQKIRANGCGRSTHSKSENDSFTLCLSHKLINETDQMIFLKSAFT